MTTIYELPDLPGAMEPNAPETIAEAMNTLERNDTPLGISHVDEIVAAMHDHGYPEAAEWVHEYPGEFWDLRSDGPIGEIRCDRGVRIQFGRFDWGSKKIVYD